MADLLVENYQDLKSVTYSILNEASDSGEDYEKNYKKSGKKSKDYDEDGEIEDESDEYAGVKDNAIKKAMHDEDEEDDLPQKSKKKKVKESYSDWRSELYERIGDVEDSIEKSSPKIVKEKKIKNEIKINPIFTESTKVKILEAYELDEFYLNELSQTAADYFYNHGLNEDGVDLLLGYLGEDKFIDFVYDISEDVVLTEAKLKPSQANLPAKTKERITGKTISRKRPEDLMGAARSAKTRSNIATKTARQAAKQPTPLTSRQERIKQLAAASRQKYMEKAKENQTPKIASRKGMGHRVLDVLDKAANAFVAGVERHNKAMKSAGQMSAQTKQTAKKAAPVIGHFMKNIPKGASGAVNMTRKLINAETDLLEVSPPSPKFERMVKHIKDRYKKGGLTKKEKSIAYATAWKAYNKSK